MDKNLLIKLRIVRSAMNSKVIREEWSNQLIKLCKQKTKKYITILFIRTAISKAIHGTFKTKSADKNTSSLS